MKITNIQYSQSRETVNEFGLKKWDKIGMEAQLEEGESVDNAFPMLKATVEDMFRKESGLKFSNLGVETLGPQPIPEVQIEKPAACIESTITDIQNCKDLAELDTYRLVAALDPKVKEVYDERYLQLYNNQINK